MFTTLKSLIIFSSLPHTIISVIQLFPFPLQPSSLSVFYSPSLVNCCWLLSFVLSLIGLSHSYFLSILFPFLFSYIQTSFLQFIFLLHKLWFLLMLNAARRPKIIVSPKPSDRSASVFHRFISEKRFYLAKFPFLYF